jgi:hypothetical protein
VDFHLIAAVILIQFCIPPSPAFAIFGGAFDPAFVLPVHLR